MLLGPIHVASDILHLVSAAAWVGALVPLAVVIGQALARADVPSTLIAREAIQRFSTLGIASVGTLVATGIFNTLVIAGSPAALVGTDYGRLLLVKVGLFLAMLLLAAINRLRLTPALWPKDTAVPVSNALRRIRLNTLLEAGIGLTIVAIVGLLGTMSPSE
jgi:putative copper resistance protein D